MSQYTPYHNAILATLFAADRIALFAAYFASIISTFQWSVSGAYYSTDSPAQSTSECTASFVSIDATN